MSDCENCSASSCDGCSKKNTRDPQDIAISNFLSQVKHKLIVMSGKGGVGKSTVAVDLALILSERGYRVGIMDVDLHGPSVAGMLGYEDAHLRAEGDKLLPFKYSDNLYFLSAQGLLANEDDPLVWRGPLKIGAIRQFMSDTEWPALDYLIVDCPPGTGDEPLTVIQTIRDAKAIIVTTPQRVSLADVRKSVNFCRMGNVPICGVVENMSGFICPHCGKEVDIFKVGGGEALAKEKNLPFLGRIPIDPMVVAAEDDGKPLDNLSKGCRAALDTIVDNVIKNA
jgi:ATP-binding protein involved in chromosome partitioning